MPKAELRDLLLRLRDELDEDEALDRSSRELLAQVRDDIEESLELSSEARRRRHPRTMERLQEAAEELQASRPGLTRAMNHVMEVLAGMGF